MKYTIEFELPNNKTIEDELEGCYVSWAVWGHAGVAKAKPVEESKKGQWVGANEYAKHITEETGEVYTVSFMEIDRFFCNQCWKPGGKLKTNYCPHCGLKMDVSE